MARMSMPAGKGSRRVTLFYRFVLAGVCGLLCAACCSDGSADRGENPLPLPSSLPLAQFEDSLMNFLRARRYARELNWEKDKGIRPAGPYIDEVDYGTHPAVRIYYSPAVMKWLRNGRRGAVAQNGMIIKEMYLPPAARFYKDSTMTFRNEDLNEALVNSASLFKGWVVMIKDNTQSADGWFWGGMYSMDQAPDTNYFSYPNFGFGQYCVRCHASAANEKTFASLENIEGYEGYPVVYKNDRTWLDPLRPDSVLPEDPPLQLHGLRPDYTPFIVSPAAAHAGPNPEFLRIFNNMGPIPVAQVVPIPPVGYDHVLSNPNIPERHFITSDQCLSCHNGFGNMMYIIDGADSVNLSPWGEWRWSMMGLAGRDPIFFAQQESEGILHPHKKDSIVNLCFHCHGAMGQRQFAIDNDSAKLFSESIVYATPETDTAMAIYGALARDGISCMVCHQIVDDGATTIFPIETGNWKLGPRDTVHGPFELVTAHPMEEALGISPVYSSYVQDSRLCGSCHTVHLPVYDSNGTILKTRYEQTTYLEWQNSAFAKPGSARSCQDCHMPNTYHNERLSFPIAAVQDQNYPQSAHLAPLPDITVRERNEYRRHTLLGINVFALQMFRQFSRILGVQLYDFYPENSQGLPQAIKHAEDLARNESAEVKILEQDIENGLLKATVQVRNLTGHKFPSGVGFRRAFIEFRVYDPQSNRTYWASGRTNSVGVILDGNNQPLPSEFFAVQADTQAYEAHYNVIRRQEQVQIYQELAWDPYGRFTTSFVALDSVIKDNRLLPRGWSMSAPYAELTEPEGNAEHDPEYLNGSGTDIIRYEVPMRGIPQSARVSVTLYYQSIPPFYLNERFRTNRNGVYASNGKDTRRLYYLASNLDLNGTAAENWKLVTGRDDRAIGR